MPDKNMVMIDTETLDKAFHMLLKLREHCLSDARRLEIDQRFDYQRRAAAKRARAAEVNAVMEAVAAAKD